MTERIVNLTHASEALGELRENIEELVDFAGNTVAEVERLDRRVNLLSDGLANLAVLLVTPSPSRWAIFKQWFRDHVYDGTPVPTMFTYIPRQDERRL